MNKYIFFFLITILTNCFCGNLPAQTMFTLPKDIQLNTKDDYARYEKVIVNAAKWLEETDLDKETDKRRDVDAFVIKWVAGTPAFTLDLDQPVSILTDKNPELLALYIASYARNILENKNAAGSFDATKAALKSIAKVYKKGIDVSRNKQLEKLSKFTTETQWDDFIVTIMKIPRV